MPNALQLTRGVVVRELDALREHNIHAYGPVLHAILDVGPYAERGSDSFPGFIDRITSWLPGLNQHECSIGRPGGFVERLRRGTYLPHIVEHVCLELQNLVGFDVSFGRARNAGAPHLYRVVVAYEEEAPARASFDAALRLTLAAMHGDEFDVTSEVARLYEIADQYRLGPSTAAIVRAARKRGIPVIRLTPGASLIQLGYGVHQKRIRASETSFTSAIAVEVCQDKPLTNTLLRAVGLPVPDGRTVRSADEACAAAAAIGLPVVVKPFAGNQGKGVGVGLSCEADVRMAWEVASQYSNTVLVERHVEGDDYRLLVVGGRMVAAARRDPAHVIGDGLRTICELVRSVNRDPRRRPGHGSALTVIRLDAASDLALRQQGLDRDSVPAAGQRVRLRTNANLSTGGTAADVTDDVHPRNVQIAELAAQILALDVAGIDVLCRDLRRPLGEQGGAIVEVNAAPGLRMHLAPTLGRPRNVGGAIVEMLFPGETRARIPIVAVTGTNGKTTVTRLVAHIFRTARMTVGMTCTDGIYVGDERILIGDCSGPRSARTVLLHPRVEVAVLETARGGILREGLGFDGIDVGVVTNVSADHLGMGGVETVEKMARVKQVVVDAVRRTGAAVLNADDPLVAAMAADTDASVVYFGRNAGSAVLAAHVAAGGRAVCVAGDGVVLQDGSSVLELIGLDRLAFAGGGKIRFQVANALAAIAAAWSAGVNPAIIARAVSTFAADPYMVPGRFNVLEIAGVEVVVDYGHNEAAMRALAEGIQYLGARRTVIVLGLPGDRRDRELLATASATLGFADEYVLYDLRDRRGREEGCVPGLIASLLPPGKPYRIEKSPEAAIRRGWEGVARGERLIAIADEVDSTLQVVLSLPMAASDETCGSPLRFEATAAHAGRT